MHHGLLLCRVQQESEDWIWDSQLKKHGIPKEMWETGRVQSWVFLEKIETHQVLDPPMKCFSLRKAIKKPPHSSFASRSLILATGPSAPLICHPCVGQSRIESVSRWSSWSWNNKSPLLPTVVAPESIELLNKRPWVGLAFLSCTSSSGSACLPDVLISW